MLMAALGGLAGAAHAQTPTPDPAPVPASPPPPPAPASPPPPVAPPATAPTDAAEPAPKKERTRARAKARRAADASERRSAPADPPRTALIGAPVGTESSSAAAIGHIPRTLEPERNRPAQAALIFVFAVGLLGFVLALTPARVLASISTGLPHHRQDLGIGLVLLMALGAGLLVLLAAA